MITDDNRIELLDSSFLKYIDYDNCTIDSLNEGLDYAIHVEESILLKKL